MLENSREFFRDKDNIVYHIGYPLSFRQLGKEPTLQVSMSEDGLKGDIDVDYRSSKSPKSLFNGHLTSSNSDVRAGENPTLHNARWQGLVQWWRDVFGKLRDAMPTQDLLGADRPDALTPLPPDRPIDAAPDRIEDAAQEFLTDWLVRRRYDDALAVLSPRALACVNLTGDGKDQELDADAARASLRRIMEYRHTGLARTPISRASFRRSCRAIPSARSSTTHSVASSWWGPCRNLRQESTCAIRKSRRHRHGVPRRHLHLPRRRRGHVGAALGPGGRTLEDRVLSTAGAVRKPGDANTTTRECDGRLSGVFPHRDRGRRRAGRVRDRCPGRGKFGMGHCVP